MTVILERAPAFSKATKHQLWMLIKYLN